MGQVLHRFARTTVAVHQDENYGDRSLVGRRPETDRQNLACSGEWAWGLLNLFATYTMPRDRKSLSCSMLSPSLAVSTASVC
jgi:hypothetical protein